jgi:hypothetical protein
MMDIGNHSRKNGHATTTPAITWMNSRRPQAPQLTRPIRLVLLCAPLRLLARTDGFGIGNPARNNFVAVFDDFPVPATIAVIGHDAVFNSGFHDATPSVGLRINGPRSRSKH